MYNASGLTSLNSLLEIKLESCKTWLFPKPGISVAKLPSLLHCNLPLPRDFTLFESEGLPGTFWCFRLYQAGNRRKGEGSCPLYVGSFWYSKSQSQAVSLDTLVSPNTSKGRAGKEEQGAFLA